MYKNYLNNNLEKHYHRHLFHDDHHVHMIVIINIVIIMRDAIPRKALGSFGQGGVGSIPQVLGLLSLVSQQLFLDKKLHKKSQFNPKKWPLNPKIDKFSLKVIIPPKVWYIYVLFRQMSQVASAHFWKKYRRSVCPNLTLLNPCILINIATGETSQDITPFHFFDKFNFHH